MTAVLDRATTTLVTEQIGRTQAFTPEGYLLVEGVRIARTGPMMYRPEELPGLDPGRETMLTIDRDADCLFDPDCIASFNGKDLTLNEHPEDMLDAKNWGDGNSVGVVMNVRRGEGVEASYLLADFLVKRQDAIDAVRSKKVREVSCGYDCEYEQIKPGLGRQVRIIGNHVAMLDGDGRCGPSCAIGDSQVATKTVIKNRTWSDRLFDRLSLAFKAKDEEAFKKEIESAKDELEEGDEGKPSPVAVHVHNYGGNPDQGEKVEPDVKDGEPDGDEGKEGKETDPLAKFGDALKGISDAMAAGFKSCEDRFAGMDEKFKAYDARFAKDAEAEKEPDGDEPVEDEESKADVEKSEKSEKADEKEEPVKDSAALIGDWRSTVSKAEILFPGAKPRATFDAKAKMTDTSNTLCKFRRSTLISALGDSKRAAHVEKASGGKLSAKSSSKVLEKTLDKMSCEAIGLVFDNAVEHARVANNSAGDALAQTDSSENGPMTAAKLQAVIEKSRLPAQPRK